MNTKMLLPFQLALILSAGQCVGASAAPRVVDPPSADSRIADMNFGVSVADPYRWLEDGKSTKTIEWVNGQDQRARNYLSNLPGLQKLEDRFHALFYINEVSTPRQEEGRLFYQRRQSDKEKPVLYWQDVRTGQEHLLLDPGRLNPD